MLRPGRLLLTGLTQSGVRLAFLNATAAANEAVARHGVLSALAAEAVGRSLCAAVLLNMSMKGEERVELQLLSQDEQAPIQKVHTESICTGEVRGHLTFGDSYNGSDSCFKGFYDGLGNQPVLHVSKVLYNQANKQQSFVQVPNGSIETGLQLFFEQSEQIDTLLRLYTRTVPTVDTTLEVNSLQTTEPHFQLCGAVLAQRMPGIEAQEWTKVTELLNDSPAVITEFLTGDMCAPRKRRTNTLDNDVQRVDMYPPLPMDQVHWEEGTVQRKPIDFFCRCNRENYLKALRSLGEHTIQDLLKFSSGDPEPLIITCEHCNEKYTFVPTELMQE